LSDGAEDKSGVGTAEVEGVAKQVGDLTVATAGHVPGRLLYHRSWNRPPYLMDGMVTTFTVE
jgi:hypothetical protein